jgi:hypothetical protein
MTSIMDTHFFEQLCQLKTFGTYNYNIFKGLNVCSSEEYLSSTFNKILNNKNHKLTDVNMVRLKSALSEIANRERNKLCQIIINSLNFTTESFREALQNMLNNGTYTNIEFISMYNNYVQNVNNMRTLLKSVYYAFETETESYKNIVIVYSNYLFYYNVVNREYDVGDKKMSLYKLFLNQWNKKNIAEFFALLKISDYFYMFSTKIFEHHASEQNLRDKFFNVELDSVMINSDDTKSNEFLTEIMNVIDKKIRGLNIKLQENDNSNEKETEKQISETCDYVRRGAKICDKVQFMVNYYNNLMSRLEDGTKFQLERQIQDVISAKNHPELYVKMKFCIKDMEDSDIITKKMHSLPLENIKFSSPKYKNVTSSMFNKNICKYFLYRTYAWSQKNDIGAINLPVQLSYYTDIFMNLPKIKNKEANPNLKQKKLYVDYDKSITCFEMKINGKTYNVKASMLQTAILMTIINKKSVSAKQIAEELCVSHLKFLSIPLNSLITIGLISRPSGMSSNDPNIVFSINNDWNTEDTNIDLVLQSKKIKERISNMKTGQPQNKPAQMTQEEETKLKADIIKYLSDGKKSEKVETISEKVKNTPDNVRTVLKQLVEKNILTMKDDLYSCQESSDSDNESDKE